MASHNREDGISRRHALECMVLVGTAVLWMVSGVVPQSLSPLGRAQAAVAIAQAKPTIPVIVKDTTSVYWQTVLAGARKAGQDFGVEIAELGAQSESDADGQIALLENAVSSNPAAVVIAPAHFAALSKPIDEAAKRVKVVAIDSTADSKALTSVLATDNVQVGRMPPIFSPRGSRRRTPIPKATWRSSPPCPISLRSISAPKVLESNS